MQAKDITDDQIFATIDAGVTVGGEHRVAPTWRDIAVVLNEYPQKVVQAKLRSMVRRGLIDGCDICGCTGFVRLMGLVLRQ